MSMADLKREIGIDGAEYHLGKFNQEFLDALALMWSGAVERELTAQDVAALFACPLAAGNLKSYSIKLTREPRGMSLEIKAQEMTVN